MTNPTPTPEDLMRLFEAIKPGRSVTFSALEFDIAVALSRIGKHSVTFSDPHRCEVFKPSNRKASKRDFIYSVLDSYIFGDVPIDMNVSYVRSSVSFYNSLRFDFFKVKKINDTAYIYKEPENCRFITQRNFELYEQKTLLKLEKLRSGIKPNEFFFKQETTTNDDELL